MQKVPFCERFSSSFWLILLLEVSIKPSYSPNALLSNPNRLFGFQKSGIILSFSIRFQEGYPIEIVQITILLEGEWFENSPKVNCSLNFRNISKVERSFLFHLCYWIRKILGIFSLSHRKNHGNILKLSTITINIIQLPCFSICSLLDCSTFPTFSEYFRPFS